MDEIGRINIECVVACDLNGVIGRDGRIPWHVPEDLARFKQITMNGVLVMGRKTFDSLPGGNPLPGRIHIVLTRAAPLLDLSRQVIYCNLAQSFLAIQSLSRKSVFIVGGEQIYRLFLPICAKIHLTRIHVDSIVVDLAELASLRLDAGPDTRPDTRLDTQPDTRPDARLDSHRDLRSVLRSISNLESILADRVVTASFPDLPETQWTEPEKSEIMVSRKTGTRYHFETFTALSRTHNKHL